MNERIKDALICAGYIMLTIVGIIAIFGLYVGLKILYHWIAEQFGIPTVWVL